ncbi:MAG: hypothetical protein WHT46_01570 [Candidatus Geothermincolales bacterium]
MRFMVRTAKGRISKVAGRLALSLLLTVIAVGTAFPGPHDALASVDRTEVQAVKDQVERARGLRAPREVSVRHMSRADLKAKILEDLEEERPQQELRSAEEIMKMLGLIPQDLDLESLLVDLYTEQIGGFYDPEDDTLYLVAEDTDLDVMDRLTLAHELVHFLQDSKFGLDRAPFSDREEEVDDDRLFAASCLVEGDAMLTSQLWARDNLTPAEILQLGQLSREVPTEVLDRAPRYIRESLLYPYQGGMEFVSRLYRKGGFAAVDEAFEDPPSSSEQVMHPEKYLEKEMPLEVTLPPCGEGDWEKAYDNVLGEFDVHQLLSLFIPDQEARKAAEGWGGNRFAYYRTPEGERVLVSVFLWDSGPDVKEFAQGLRGYLEGRFGPGLRLTTDGSWTLAETGDFLFAWRESERSVFLVQATSRRCLDVARSSLDEMGIGDGAAAGAGEEEPGEETGDRWRLWVVISLVSALFLLGLILSLFLFFFSRGRPTASGGRK